MTSRLFPFIRAAIRNPRQISTIFPTTPYLATQLVEVAGFKNNDFVLELGCGTGAISKYIFRQLSQHSSYLGIEIDPELASYLREKFPTREFTAASAEDLSARVKDQQVDKIVASLPWTLFDAGTQSRMIDEVMRVLKPGGELVFFVCTHAHYFEGVKSLMELFEEKMTPAEEVKKLWVNWPPAVIYKVKKPFPS